MTYENAFMKEIIYFHERRIHTEKKQILHLTILPWIDPCGEVKYLAK
jgi:hypothetical protein